MLLGTPKPSSQARTGPSLHQQSKQWKSQIEEVLKKAAESHDWIFSIFGACRGWTDWDGSLLSGMRIGVVYSIIESKADWCKLLAGIIIKPIASLPGLEELENLARGNRWEVTKEEEILTSKAKNLIEKVQAIRIQVKNMLSGELSKQMPYKEFEFSLLLLFQIYQLGVAIPELQSLKDQVEKYRRSDSLVSNTLLTTGQLSQLIQATAGDTNCRLRDSEPNSSSVSVFKVNDGALSNPTLLGVLRDEVLQRNMMQRLESCLTIESGISRLLELSSMSVKDLCTLCKLMDAAASVKLTFEHMKHVMQLRDSFKWVLFLNCFLSHLEGTLGVRLKRCHEIDHLLTEPIPEQFDRTKSLEWVKSNLQTYQGLPVDESLSLALLETNIVAFTNILHSEADHSLLAELLQPTTAWQLLDPTIQRLIDILSQATQQLQVRGLLVGPNCSIDDLELIEEELDRRGKHYLPILVFVRRQKGIGLALTKEIQSLASQLVKFTLNQDESSIAFTQHQQTLRQLRLEFERLESELAVNISPNVCDKPDAANTKVIVANSLVKSKAFRSCVGILGLLNCASSLGMKGTISREELSQLEPFFQIEEYHKLKSHQLVSTIIETRNQLKIYEELLSILHKHEQSSERGGSALSQQRLAGSHAEVAEVSNGRPESKPPKRQKECNTRLQISQVREHLVGMGSADCVIDYSREVEKVAQKVQDFENFEKRAMALAERGALGLEVFSEQKMPPEGADQTLEEERLPLMQAWRFLGKTKLEAEEVLDGLLNSPFYTKVENDLLALTWALECLKLWLEADSLWAACTGNLAKPSEPQVPINQGQNQALKDEDPDYIIERRSASEEVEVMRGPLLDLDDAILFLSPPSYRTAQTAETWCSILEAGQPYKSLQPTAFAVIQKELKKADDVISSCRVSVVENVKFKTLLDLHDRVCSLRIDVSDDLHYFQERFDAACKIAEQIDRVILAKRVRFRIRELDDLVQKVKNSGVSFEDKLVKLEGVVAFCHAFESTLKTIKKNATEVKKAKKTYESIPLISPAFDSILKQLSAEESLLDSLELLLSDDSAAEDYDAVNSMLKSLSNLEYYDVSTSILAMFKRKCRLILRIHHGITPIGPDFTIPLAELVGMRSYASKQLEIMKEAQQEQMMRWNQDTSNQTKSTIDSSSNSEGCESLDVIYSFLGDLVRKSKNYLASLENNKSDPIKAAEEAPETILKFIDIKAEVSNLKAKLKSRHLQGPRASVLNEKPMFVPLREALQSEAKQEVRSGRFSLVTNQPAPVSRSAAQHGIKPFDSTQDSPLESYSIHRSYRDRFESHQHDPSSRRHHHSEHQHNQGPSNGSTHLAHPPQPQPGLSRPGHLPAPHPSLAHQQPQHKQPAPLNSPHERQQQHNDHNRHRHEQQQHNQQQQHHQHQDHHHHQQQQAADTAALRQRTAGGIRTALGRNPFLSGAAEDRAAAARDLERRLFARSAHQEYPRNAAFVVRLLEKAVGLEKVSRLLDLKDFCIELIFILMNKSSEELSKLNRDQPSLQRVLDEANRNIEHRRARSGSQDARRQEMSRSGRSELTDLRRSPERSGANSHFERDYLSKRTPILPEPSPISRQPPIMSKTPHRNGAASLRSDPAFPQHAYQQY